MFTRQLYLIFAIFVAYSVFAPALCLGQIKWNSSVNGIWSAGPNWFGGIAPQPGDFVTIDAQDVNQPDYWVTLDTDATVDSLTLSTMTGGIKMSNRNFTTVNGATLSTGRTSMFDSIWNTNTGIGNGGDFQLFATTANNSNTINGDFSNNGLLNFYADARSSTFTVNGEMGNTGIISFKHDNGGASVLNVNNSGAFLNTGVIQSYAAINGTAGTTYIRVNHFNNANQVVNESGATMVFDRAGATYVNGSIFAGTNGGFTFSNFGSFQNLAGGGNMQATAFSFVGQGSGTSTMTNDGYIGSISGNVNIQNVALTNTGTIAGVAGSTLTLSGVNVSNSGSFVGFGTVNISNVNVNGPGTYTNEVGTTMTLTETTFATQLINNGIGIQTVTNSTRNNSLNGGFTNSAGASYRVEAAATGINTFNNLNVDGDISNSGTISLVNSSQSGFRSTQSFINQTNGTFTNETGAILESNSGSSSFLFNNYVRTDNLINNGTIRNNMNRTLYFDRTNAVYENNGIIDAAAGNIYFDNIASFSNEANGVIDTGGGNVYIDGLVFTNRGTLTGDNSLIFSGGAELQNEGLISPGQSPGKLTVTGNMLLSSTSVFLVEVGGLDQGTTYDWLAVSGTSDLDGFLDIDLFNGFVPEASDSFTILTSGSTSGFFSNAISQVAFETGTFDVSYSGNSVVLTNYASSVPEPSSTSLVLIALGAVVIRRRQRRNC